jgi:hypothetical protein
MLRPFFLRARRVWITRRAFCFCQPARSFLDASHDSTSDSRQPMAFVDSWICRGNWPARSSRQIVVPERPTRSTTVGLRRILV